MASGNPLPGEVASAARDLGRELDPEQAAGLAVYLGLLETWNRRTNLVGPRVWPEMLSQLAADSWHLADLLEGLDLPPEPVSLDFGAGAGIPGVPLRLFWGAGRYVMIEPRAKRAGFLRQCVAMMRLRGTEVFEGRAEDVAERADICLSRAFQPWREFLETAGRYLRRRDGTDGGSGIPRAPLVVVFANEAAPGEPVPGGYVLAKTRAYPARGATGYFWVFTPSN